MYAPRGLQEDTYKAVKTHMFDLLAEIASRFLPNQLDLRFNKYCV
jgi:hypothetical protein